MNSLVRLFTRITSARAPHEPTRTASRRRLLNRIGSLATFAAVVALSPAAHAQAGNAAPTQIRNVVLVHGLFADGSSWGKVIPLLQARGLHVTSVQNPLTSLPDDAAAVKRALAQQDGPTLLVGHSYAGMVITEAGDDPKVAGLVYIAARAPDVGEDYAALTRKFTPALASAGIHWDASGIGVSAGCFERSGAADASALKRGD